MLRRSPAARASLVAVVTALAACASACSDGDPARAADHPRSMGTGGAAGAASAGGAGGDASQPPLAWGPCDTANWPDGYPKPVSGVECTTIDVPIDHAAASGPTMPLRVARQKSNAFPTGKAVFNLAGGPGGASVTQSGIIPVIQSALLDDFDLVYMDQRGTGGSNYLDCPGGYPQTEAEWEGCAAKYADAPDLDHYLTVDAAHDLDFVRARLGYDRISVRGGSYGTRFGLEYLRQHADHIEALVLDGLAPPDLDLMGEGLKNFGFGVQMLVGDCSADPACIAVSPSLEQDLLAVRAARTAAPNPITVGGQAYVEDGGLFTTFLEAFLYTAKYRYQVPRAIHEAAQGDPTRWYSIASDAFGMTITSAAPSMAAPSAPPNLRARASRRAVTMGQDYVAPGLFATVECAEFFPNSAGVAALEQTAAGQTWSDSSEVDVAKSCAKWNVAPISASLRTAVTSDLPVLLLSGAIDLNTLAAWGDHAKATLPNATHLVVPYATHSTIYVPCVDDIVVAYFRSGGNIAAVDTSCLGALVQPAW